VIVLRSRDDERQVAGRVLVIGYGNTLRRDDAVGVRTAESLRAHPGFGDVDVLAVHQLTPELALDISAASLVVFIDADVLAEPGSVQVQPLTPMTAQAPADQASAAQTSAGPGASSHHVGASELLALANTLTGSAPRALSVAIGVADLEMGDGLSPEVEALLPTVVEIVTQLVAGGRPEDDPAWP
jgi:hydrogenase maturation protease